MMEYFGTPRSNSNFNILSQSNQEVLRSMRFTLGWQESIKRFIVIRNLHPTSYPEYQSSDTIRSKLWRSRSMPTMAHLGTM